MENAENEMEKMKKMEDEFFKQFSQSLQTGSTTEKSSAETRRRRSIENVGQLETEFEENHHKRSRRSTSNANELKAENMGSEFEHQERNKRSVKNTHQLIVDSEANQQARARRSLGQRRMNTMSRSSYRRMTFMRRSRQVVCHRRCLWRKMYFLCRYGITLDEPCECE